MNARSALRPATGLRFLLLALLLFAMQPLLHAHPSSLFPEDHRDVVHGPGPDFAKAAVGDADFVPDPVVVAEGTRQDDPPAVAGTIAARGPASDATRLSSPLPAGLAPQPPPRSGAPRGPPR